jgi:hypothetical protein
MSCVLWIQREAKEKVMTEFLERSRVGVVWEDHFMNSYISYYDSCYIRREKPTNST